MSETMPTPSHWNALRVIVKRLPANLAYYGSALGAIVLAGGGQLPSGLEFVAGSIGGNMLSNLISDILKDENLPNDEIQQRAEEAINKSDIANLLTKQDFLQGYARLIQRLDAQKTISQDILDELRTGFSKVATADQVEELKRLILQLMQHPPRAIERKTHIFISYARKDGVMLTRHLHKALIEKGFDAWFDQESMRSRGSAFPAELKKGIDEADYVLFISTPGALQSEWVMQLELDYALSICRAIIPIVYKGGFEILPTILSMRHAINFEGCDTDGEVFKNRLEELVERNLSYPPDTVTSKVFSDYSLRHHLYRSIEVQKIKELFLADEGLGRKPRIYKDSKKTIGLYGMGGVGKTVLSVALAGDCDVRRAFVDGIYWVTLGDIDETDREVRLTQAQSILITQLTGQEKHTNSVMNGTIELSGLLHDKKCLLILDDVWKPDQASIFRDVLGEHCRMLMTTRHRWVLADLDALEYEIKPLSGEAALELLARVSRKSVEELPAEATEIVQLCKGLPLALAMIGSSIRDQVENWRHYLDALKRGDVDVVEHPILDYQHRNLGIVFDVSIEQLNRGRYGTNGQLSDQILDLAIFPNDQPIPLQALERLWYSRYAPVDIHKILNFFADRSLVQRQGDNFVVHDLFMGFLRQKLGGQLIERHNALLVAYNPDKKRWHDILDDEYLYNHLVYHLEAANRLDDIHILFQDKHWSEQRRSPLGLMSDFERAQQLVVASETETRLRYSIFRGAINETYSQIPVTASSMLLQSRLVPIETLIRTAQEMRGSEAEKLEKLLEVMAFPALTKTQQEACADAIIAVMQTWTNWTYEASSSTYEKEKQTAIISLIHRVINAVGVHADRFSVLRRVLWKQAFSLADEARETFLEQLLTPPLSDEDRSNFVQDVYTFQREGYDLEDQISILKRIAPFQKSPEREQMWGYILNQLLPLWRESKWGISNFYDKLGELIPELTNVQRASIRRQIWEYWLIFEHHYSVPWKFLPEELFSVAWQKLENIREDDIGRFVERIVPYIPYEMLPSIENKLETLAGNVYAQERLPRIKAVLVRRNLRLSQVERKNAYLKLVHEYIDRYQLTDLLKYIPQELTLQIWVLKLADYRDFRSNEKRRSGYGPYRIEETLYFLIDRMPVMDVPQAIDSLLDEVFRDETLYTSSLDPKTTSDLCNALLRRLSEENKGQKSKAIVEKAEIEAQQELESQTEKEYRGLNLSLLGYLITLLDPNMQIDYWTRFFELVASIKSHIRQALHIVGHLERYPADQRLPKWQEAWQIVKASRDSDSSYYSWGLESVIAGIPVVFEGAPLKDKEVAMEIAQAILTLERPFIYGDRFSKGWLGLAEIILVLDPDIVHSLYSKFIARNMNPVLSCAFMPFLPPEQIDTLLVYKREDFKGVMYFLDDEFRSSLATVIAQWSGSTAALVWSRSLDSIEQFISDRPESYHPDFFMVWLRLIAEAVPNYDVVAAWKHLLDHREVFWFNAWQRLGAILIEHLQPVSDEEAIRIIWRDIQDIGKDTATLQSAIAPKLPTDIVNKMRTQFAVAPLPPNDVFVCALPTYIYYGGGPQTNSFFEYERWWTQQSARTSNKIGKFAKLLLWLIAIVNSLLYPVVYLYITLSKITKPVHRYLSLGIFILFFPVLLVFSIVEQIFHRISRFRISPFWLMRSLVRGAKGTVEPVVEIVKIHQLPKSISEQRFADLLSKADLSDFASARPLLQRIGGRKLRYTAHRAYQDAIEWWAGATIE